jgi:hypothetical protein
MRDCPECGCTLVPVGSVGICDHDGTWDAQADRWDCPEGHTFLIVETARLEPEEIDAENP